MKTLIQGGWVVAFDGTEHTLYENGAVVYENDRVIHAGADYKAPVDARIEARGKLIAPGFINTHVHPSGNIGDYLLNDASKSDYLTANYMAYAAPQKGKLPPFSSEAIAAIRRFMFLHAMKQGATTIIDVGGVRGDWDAYVKLVDEMGVRIFFSPPFRDRHTFTDDQGRLYYESDEQAGRQGLEEAIAFIKRYDGAATGRLRGMLCPSQVETCSEPLLRAAKQAARELRVPIFTHAGGNLVEFHRIMGEYRKTPVHFLADIGFLDETTLLGHVVFTTAHPWSVYPYGDDLKILAETGVTVGHCPYKYAKMAMTLHSYQRYLDAGVTVALGTDTFPMNFIAEMRWAAVLTRVVDGNFQAGRPRDVFNSATLGGCRFIQRQDLGRLAPGSKADILIINLDDMALAPYHDPIKALIDYGDSRDIETVIVDGKTLVDQGRSVLCDEAEVYAQMRQTVQRAWGAIPTWHWAGYDVNRLVPPAFTVHRA
jgi:cytosine/adenosine deaminase-related metal-dependent hydrolase